MEGKSAGKFEQQNPKAMIFWIAGGLMLAILIGLLWTPFRVVIDTRQEHFSVAWLGLAQVNWAPNERLDCIELRTWFFRKKMLLAKAQPERSKKTEAVKKPTPSGEKKRTLTWRKTARMARNVVRTFQVRQFDMDWDTDDFLWNAWLFPLAYQWGGKNVRINFQGRRELVLVVENRLVRVAGAILKTFISKN